MSVSDRLKGPFIALVKQALSRVDYYALYRARVVAQSPDFTKLDIQPDDSRLPPMSGILLRHGVPGLKVQITPGAFVMVGWSGGDPSQPYVQLWEGGESVIQETFTAQQINLGANTAIDFLIKGTTYRSQQATLDTALTVFFTALSTFFTAMHGDAPLLAIAPISYNAAGVMAAACAPALAAVTAFEAASATYLSTVARTI